MTEPLPAPLPTQVLRADLTCRRCGYNLRGMAMDRDCPECGEAVEWSARGYKLRYADPDWVRNLRRGTDLILGVIGFALLMLFMLVIGAVNGFDLAAAGVAAAANVVSVIVAAGVWLVTTPEPRIIADEAFMTLRRAARHIFITALLLTQALVIDTLAPYIPLRPTYVLWWIAALLLFIGLVCTLVHMQRLATRSSQRLAQGTHKFLMALSVAVVVNVAMVFLPADFGAAACCIAVADTFAVLVFGIWFLVLMGEYRGEFDAAVISGLVLPGDRRRRVARAADPQAAPDAPPDAAPDAPPEPHDETA